MVRALFAGLLGVGVCGGLACSGSSETNPGTDTSLGDAEDTTADPTETGSNTSDAASDASSTPDASSTGLKWNPGNYVLLDPNIAVSTQLSHIDQLASGAAGVRGVQVRIWWGEIETSEGVYDFSCIDQFLNAAKAVGKQLVVQVMDRKFASASTSIRSGCTAKAFPDDMRASGDVWTGGFAANGSIATSWEAPTMSRYINVLKAVIARYDDDDSFEMLTTEETSPGLSGGSAPEGSGYTSAKYAAQWIRMIEELAPVRKRTGLNIYTNSLAGYLPQIIEAAYQNGWAIGGPDVIPDDPVPGDNVLVGNRESPDHTCCGLRDYRGRTTIAYAVQSPERGGKEGWFTPPQITDHAVQTLRANYLFWTRVTWNPGSAPTANIWSELDLPYINANPDRLVSTCPSNIACAGQSSIGVTPIEESRIFQRSGTTYNLPVSGTYSGAGANDVQLRVMSGATEVVGWTTVDASLSAGTWSGSLSVPQGGMYHLEARLRDAGGTVMSSAVGSGSWGVGALFAVIGSSSPQRWFSIGTGTANARCLKFNENGWAALGTSGVAAINFCNRVVSELGIPVGMLDYGVSGTKLSQWMSTSDSSWLAFAAGVSAVGGKLQGVVQAVGYNDATGDISSRASHAANIATLIGNVRTLTAQATLPIFLIQSQRREGGSETQYNRLRPAESDAVAAGINVYFAGATLDLTLSDGIHPDATGYGLQGHRVGLSVQDVLGNDTCSRGPFISAVSVVSATTTDVTVTHRCGSDFTPTSGITGFVVLDGGSNRAVSAAVRQNATTIRLTHAAVSGNRSVLYQVGANPAVGGAVKDNSPLALPLEFTPDAVAP